MRRNDAAIENKSRENSNTSSHLHLVDGGIAAGLPVIAIFDIGKTNKKILLFNEQYRVVFEESTQLKETVDEDGFACENVALLTQWLRDSFEKIIKDKRFNIKAINFSGYGASFVHLDEMLQPCLPLYNYLKPFAEDLKQQFYNNYGGESLVAKQTASPVLGNLNSGMQLYRLKYEKPGEFANIKYSLHLPQYASFVLSGNLCSDITSIGCHTNLWHFQKKAYHKWVSKEGVGIKLPAIKHGTDIAANINNTIAVGIGLHDSSAALIPYLCCFAEPFILLSTGTWCISLNPFNHKVLSDYELHHDCLCYLTYEGSPVKASRLFAGYEHEQQVKKLAEHFDKPVEHYTTIQYNAALIKKKQPARETAGGGTGTHAMVKASAFGSRPLASFKTYEEAYHQLVADLIEQQVKSTKLVLAGTPVKKIFVDGGFGKNDIYMHLLANAFKGIQVYAASVPQASALGAAMAIHKHWNKRPVPEGLVEAKHYIAK